MNKGNREKKHQLIVYKGEKCKDCGGVFPDCCFDFDHREPGQKSFTISHSYTKSLIELMAEADKCDLVCANCHRIRTSNNPKVAAKISASKTGKKASLEARANMGAVKLGKPGVNLGRVHTPEVRARRLARKFKHSLASRLKMSNSHKGKPSGNLGHKRKRFKEQQ